MIYFMSYFKKIHVVTYVPNVGFVSNFERNHYIQCVIIDEFSKKYVLEMNWHVGYPLDQTMSNDKLTHFRQILINVAIHN